MKVICIDARFWGIHHTGIGRYIENLIDHLPQQPEVKIVLIIPPELKNEPKLAQFETHIAHLHPYSVFSQSEMFFLLAKIRPDLTHFTHFSLPVLWPGKYIVTIHDLIKHYSFGLSSTTRTPLVYWSKYVLYIVFIWFILRRANHIIVPTHYWKLILATKHRISPQKISVTHEGVSGQFCREHQTQAFDLPKPYVIYTGNLYPHKNVDTLIKAIDLIGGKIKLVVVCARSVFENRLPISANVIFLGRVPDTQLQMLYRESLAFVFPSLIEGFGLPGLEAMACSTPVIAANASCLPEVYEDAALYFNPTDPEDLADKIKQVYKSTALRKALIAKGTQQVKKYSWAKMAQETWRIYQQELP